MKVEKALRVFKHGGLELEDPDPNQTAEEVKDFYARVYPELTNAEIEGPEHKGAKTVYEFRRAVGTKGMGPIDFEPLIYLGMGIGILVAFVLAMLGWGIYYLYHHLQWIP